MPQAVKRSRSAVRIHPAAPKSHRLSSTHRLWSDHPECAIHQSVIGFFAGCLTCCMVLFEQGRRAEDEIRDREAEM